MQKPNEVSRLPRREWSKPEVTVVKMNEAETGINFGPEILILLS